MLEGQIYDATKFMVVDNDLEQLLASFEGDKDSLWPASATALNAGIQITATVTQRASNRTSPGIRARDHPLGSVETFQSSEILPGPEPTPQFANHGRLHTSLPLPIALPPPVDSKNIRQIQLENSIIAAAARYFEPNPGDKRLAFPDLSAEEPPGMTDLRHEAWVTTEGSGLELFVVATQDYLRNAVQDLTYYIQALHSGGL